MSSENRSLVVRNVPVTPPPGGNTNFVIVSVTYDLGGDGITGRYVPRGYYIFVVPETHKEGWKTVVAYSGTKMLVLASARFSQAKLEQLYKEALDGMNGTVDSLVRHVMNKNNLSPREKDASE